MGAGVAGADSDCGVEARQCGGGITRVTVQRAQIEMSIGGIRPESNSLLVTSLGRVWLMQQQLQDAPVQVPRPAEKTETPRRGGCSLERTDVRHVPRRWSG
jgi:hypothetical protein